MSAAGTYEKNFTLSGETSDQVTVQVPPNSAGKNFHVILEVTDDGTPTLTGYRRMIIEPK